MKNILKQLILIFVLISFSPANIFAQLELKGRVLDAETKEPIVNANVYLDGTTIGTVTDTDGRFSISLKEPMYTHLIIRYIGYETTVISEPCKKIPDVIYLNMKNQELNEVVVTSKPIFSRAQKLRIFRKLLLGETQAGRACKILNEDDVKLIYNPDDNTLSAYSNVPIEIKNDYLKYNISWEIVSFHVQYNKPKTLAVESAKLISIQGLASFLDEAPSSNSIRLRRENVYRFSPRRFFNLLAKEDINMSDFKVSDINQKEFLFKAGDLFVVTPDTVFPTCKKIELNEKANGFRDKNGISIEVKNIQLYKTTSFTNDATKLYNNRDFSGQYYALDYVSISNLTFFSDSFYVDSYGNTDLLDNLFVTGFMGKRRVGDLLPLDYIPSAGYEEQVRKRNVDSIDGDVIYIFDTEKQRIAVYKNNESSPL